jgi:hypothetical protein
VSTVARHEKDAVLSIAECYQVLELQYGADPSEIKRAYRDLARIVPVRTKLHSVLDWIGTQLRMRSRTR